MTPARSGQRRDGAVAATAAVVLGLVSAGCGLPNDVAPRVIAADKVPFNLLDSTTTTAPDGTVNAPTDVAALYFPSADGSLVRVTRPVADREPATVLSELVSGRPDPGAQGLTSAIPDGTRILNAQPESAEVFAVTLSPEIQNVQGPTQKIAFAQLVWTATELGVGSVRFRVNAGGSDIPLTPPNDLATTDRPLNRNDYLSLTPDSTPATTTTRPRLGPS
ncbi:MAG: GerMN domain-containing protein [Acidimicrobiia bacterium]